MTDTLHIRAARAAASCHFLMNQGTHFARRAA